MRYVRFLRDGQPRHGIVEQERILEIEAPGSKESKFTGRSHAIDEVKLLAPVKPGKVIGVGLNYADHIAEFNNRVPSEPIIFLKPSSSVIGTNSHIIYPGISKRVDFEAELAVVIGEVCRHVTPKAALQKVWGYTCGNDVTARDLQRRDNQWTRAKSFDTFCPLGPWIKTDINPDNLEIVARVNGEVRQRSNTNQMIFRVEDLIAFVSEVMTLSPGDVIMTGTPSGVGPLEVGDEICVEIEGLGVLRNDVVAG
ncbi:MAG: fumarylacetoacetate hydrolase family protein [Syntrophomonadales bacterium]|jgi:2-keto-4-pentenoate hydratase/2-oxohepta-3-ene-1,7-dioic acid hydratase in catechol pathway